MKKKWWRVLSRVLAAVSAVLLILLGIYFISMRKNAEEAKKLSSNARKIENVQSTVLPKNPINFKTLKKENKDIYAWINIPNTQVDYPIVQAYSEDDDFYLDHNIQKNYDINGAIYTEKLNSKDFGDRNTVIYGHNMLDGSMFQNLHKFRDKVFFDKNKYFTIYTEGHILKYEIFAAYKYDDRHILNSFDFENDEVFEEYLKEVQSPRSLEVNKRQVTLTKESRLVTLSTCIGNESSYRYLVQGVLVDDTVTE